MPRSRRDKKISLTQTTKKGNDLKQNVIEKVQKAVGEYNHIFVFHTNNIRNGKLKKVRMLWRDSKFLFGKNKVMAHALGRDESSEVQPNIHKLAEKIEGQCGLLFTNKKKEEVIEFFNKHSESEYAMAGFVPSETITVPEGPLPPEYIHSMEPMFRKLGMPVLLQKGVIMVLSEYKLCKEGKPITPQQSRLLKLFNYKLDEFKVTLEYVWSKEDGSFEKL
ncbi:mRNA turnover protein 4 homolog [Planococcus citri]|uniref:mRNA turnover protein 4 homolog n=1 Tax=Planococcus citri TaxID=170843 RepID=UPI0031F8C994